MSYTNDNTIYNASDDITVYKAMIQFSDGSLHPYYMTDYLTYRLGERIFQEGYVGPTPLKGLNGHLLNFGFHCFANLKDAARMCYSGGRDTFIKSVNGKVMLVTCTIPKGSRYSKGLIHIPRSASSILKTTCDVYVSEEIIPKSIIPLPEFSDIRSNMMNRDEQI